MFGIISARKYKKIINHKYSKIDYLFAYAKAYPYVNRHLRYAAHAKLSTTYIRINPEEFGEPALTWEVTDIMVDKLKKLNYNVEYFTKLCPLSESKGDRRRFFEIKIAV